MVVSALVGNIIYSRTPPWHFLSSGMISSPPSLRGPLRPASCSSQCWADSNPGLRNCTENIRCPMHLGLRPSTAARWFNFNANLHNSTNLASYAPASEVRLDVEVLHVDLPPFPRGVGEVIQWESHELNNRFENISITKYNIFAIFNLPSDLIPQQSTGKMFRRQIHLPQGFLLKFLDRQASSHSPPTLE